MEHSDICSLINLLEINGIGPQKVQALVSSYRKPSEIFSLSTKKICEVEGVKLKTARSIQNVNNHDFGLSEVEKADKLGEKLVVSNLNQKLIHVDHLVSDTGMELRQMLSILLELEIKGVVQKNSGKHNLCWAHDSKWLLWGEKKGNLALLNATNLHLERWPSWLKVLAC